MKLIEITSEHRNDFHGILECEFCQKTQTVKNGYHDSNYHQRVIPRIQCLACGKRTKEDDTPGISDPGTSGGVAVKQIEVVEKRWAVDEETGK